MVRELKLREVGGSVSATLPQGHGGSPQPGLVRSRLGKPPLLDLELPNLRLQCRCWNAELRCGAARPGHLAVTPGQGRFDQFPHHLDLPSIGSHTKAALTASRIKRGSRSVAGCVRHVSLSRSAACRAAATTIRSGSPHVAGRVAGEEPAAARSVLEGQAQGRPFALRGSVWWVKPTRECESRPVPMT